MNEFLAMMQAQDPQRYAEVCDKYPVLSKSNIKRIRRTELTRGLIGLDPRDSARLPAAVASEHGFDSEYEDDE